MYILPRTLFSLPQGAPPHSREAIIRALLAAPLLGISTFTALHYRLDTDLRFRYQCGFDISRRAPSISTLSRVFATITKKELAEQLFYDLVQNGMSWCSPYNYGMVVKVNI